MPNLSILPLMLLLAAPALPGEDSDMDGRRFAQLSIHERIVIRIPRLPFTRRSPRDAQSPIEWTEKSAPKCMPMEELASASINGADSIDLTTVTGKHIRAKLDDDCPPIDFYSGFYMKPTVDGMVCADRDVIRSRSGGACPIRRFKRLVPKR